MKARRRALKAAHACNRVVGRTAKRRLDDASSETVKGVSFFCVIFFGMSLFFIYRQIQRYRFRDHIQRSQSTLLLVG